MDMVGGKTVSHIEIPFTDWFTLRNGSYIHMCPWRCEAGFPGRLEGYWVAGMLPIYPRKAFKAVCRGHAVDLVNIEDLGN